MQPIAFLDRLSKVSLLLVAFLLPLWFLPLTQNILAYQKQAVLLLLVFLGLVAWLAKIVNRGELKLRVSWIFLPLLFVLLGVGLSVVFSHWPYASFWGWPLDVGDSFLTLLVFGVLSFLTAQALDSTKELFRLFFAFLISGVLASFYTILQVYGLFLLPFSFAQSSSFNTVGNVNAVALFAGALLPLALVFAFVSRLILRWLLWIFVVVLFFTLVLLNFKTAWIVLTAGLLVLLAFGMWNLRKRAEFGWVSFPMALIIVAVFFLVFPVSLPGAPRTLPLEVSPSQGATFDIAKQTLSRNAFLGSGPGTFSFEYAKYRPAELNQTIFWGTRFASGASEMFNWLITKGLVGILGLLLLWGTGAVIGFRTLFQKQEDSFSWMLTLGLFASLVGILVSQLLYPTSFLLWMMFWMVLGGIAFLSERAQKTFLVAQHPFLALGSSFVFLVVLIFGLGLLFIGGQKYAAEMQYLQGAQASAKGDLDKAIAKIFGAASLNPAVDVYWRDLSQLYLAKVNEIASNQALSKEERQQQTQAAVSNAVAAARAASEAAPANVANWNVKGFVYRNLIGIQGAEAFARESYEKAAALEPVSPFPWTELARVYVLQAQNLAQEKNAEEQKQEVLQKALESLQKALELKSDYAPAHYLIAVVYEQQGKEEEAIAKLEETKRIASPNDIGLAFQLGVIYWQRQELDKAQQELERAKSINPNYSNARYILGLVYDKKGEKEKAKAEFDEVARLNPDNEDIQKVLQNLQKGLPALQGITPGQPPLQETPPEIQEQTGE